MLLRLWWFESTHTHIKFGSVAQNGQSGSSFACAGLAHQAQSALLANGNIYAVDRMHIRIFCFVMDYKVLNI